MGRQWRRSSSVASQPRRRGLLPDARLSAVDAFYSAGNQDRTDAARLIAAIETLADRGVRVINLSLSLPPEPAPRKDDRSRHCQRRSDRCGGRQQRPGRRARLPRRLSRRHRRHGSRQGPHRLCPRHARRLYRSRRARRRLVDGRHSRRRRAKERNLLCGALRLGCRRGSPLAPPRSCRPGGGGYALSRGARPRRQGP